MRTLLMEMITRLIRVGGRCLNPPAVVKVYILYFLFIITAFSISILLTYLLT